MSANEPFVKGQSPSSKLNNPTRFTKPHLKLFLLIHHIPETRFLNEDPWLRENPLDADEYTNELNKDGSPKSYSSDLVDYELKLVVEAKGKAHKTLGSAYETKRAEWFKREGYELLEFDNVDIKKVPHLVLQIVELKVKAIRLRQRMDARPAW